MKRNHAEDDFPVRVVGERFYFRDRGGQPSPANLPLNPDGHYETCENKINCLSVL
jgi:hypothetical protein